MPQQRGFPTSWQKLKNRFFPTHLSILSSEHSKPSRYSKGWRMRNHWRRRSSNPNQRHRRRQKKKSRRGRQLEQLLPLLLPPLSLTSTSLRRLLLRQSESRRLTATLPCSDFFGRWSGFNSLP